LDEAEEEWRWLVMERGSAAELRWSSRPEGLLARILALCRRFEEGGEGWRARRGGARLFIVERG
jgi:hypothetical protein